MDVDVALLCQNSSLISHEWLTYAAVTCAAAAPALALAAAALAAAALTAVPPAAEAPPVAVLLSLLTSGGRLFLLVSAASSLGSAAPCRVGSQPCWPRRPWQAPPWLRRQRTEWRALCRMRLRTYLLLRPLL